jgi:hypothetical protein
LCGGEWTHAPPVAGRVEETRRHCSTIIEDGQNSPALFPKFFFFCNFQMLLLYLD